MELPKYIDFICSKCGSKYWTEYVEEPTERQNLINKECRKPCSNCGSEESVQWKISKD